MPWEMAGMDPGTPVLLAFSGGADSRALLELLREGAGRDGFAIALAHVNHGIRGEEADRDQRFCESVGSACGLRIFTAVRDVPALAKEHHTTVEEEARRVRYEFFEMIMERERIPLLVTAHQADDQLETMLFRLCRGTGMRGLCGIPAIRRFGIGYAVRPMLEITSREIRAYCAENGLEYMTDSTNADTAYARNRIRAEVVPILEKLYDDPQKRAAALARELCETEDYFREQETFFLRQNGGGGLSCKLLASLHPVLQKRILSAWLAGSGITPERVHLDALEGLIGAENGKSSSMPGGKRVVRHRGRLWLKENAEPVSYRLPAVPGEIGVPGTNWIFSVGQLTAETVKIYKNSTKNRNRFSLPSAMIERAYLRPMGDGDQIMTRGAHHAVRRLYREAGIPPAERTSRPMLCDEEGILWIPGIAARDGVGTEPREGDFLFSFRQKSKM